VATPVPLLLLTPPPGNALHKSKQWANAKRRREVRKKKIARKEEEKSERKTVSLTIRQMFTNTNSARCFHPTHYSNTGHGQTEHNDSTDCPHQKLDP
jgi:hypothetical protein